ncbi:DUF2255 family protein [Microbacterium sp. ET2]|uniref:DUF2255 family protein n=1 Tax=Microbacterium albipurpureum TaxID=3050384 RepID=UPI00259C89EC|nr:DUF2255 family protein [Microbacterium sp. ET2 (Ac-2212)]WJL94356.1 DUF2255 family protein [Microbacterium sp. ET2 (Ac-2212)]
MTFLDVVNHLDATRVVAIITRRQDGSPTATPIWAVVIDGVPYVRSAYGEKAWWYRHVMAGRDVAFAMADGAVAERDKAVALDLPRERVALEPVPADNPINDRIDEALWTKYADEPSSVEETITPRARACTFRVVAA